jgi:copper resistance protein B
MKVVCLNAVYLHAFLVYLFLNVAVAQEMDHSTMDHSTMDHSTMDHSQMRQSESSVRIEPITPIPAITDADRLAAFPKVDKHAMHGGSAIHSMVLVDQFEVWEASPSLGLAWDTVAWIGTDTKRLWLRSEGTNVDARLESATLEVLAGHSTAPWWDVVVGVRHDFGASQPQNFFAIGVMGLSPYKFEADLTAYVGEGGQSAVRIQFEYEALFTNRLILQPKLEVNFYGKDDAVRGIGSGLSNTAFGLRLRYEVSRKFAPYIGVSWEQTYGQSADYMHNVGELSHGMNVLAGIRVWF